MKFSMDAEFLSLPSPLPQPGRPAAARGDSASRHMNKQSTNQGTKYISIFREQQNKKWVK